VENNLGKRKKAKKNKAVVSKQGVLPSLKVY
jgi:hypothetical protein